jgi:hypothetical protein
MRTFNGTITLVVAGAAMTAATVTYWFVTECIKALEVISAVAGNI